MQFRIKPWGEIAENYSGTILLGNGASISVDSCFSYGSLITHAKEQEFFNEDVQQLFDSFNTVDFELILRIVWQASNVNRSLRIPDERTHAAYVRVRECLIQTVRSIHPEYGQVEVHLPHIYRFLRRFDTVLSLNYDLLVYWAMIFGRDIVDGHAFKDCFVGDGVFDENWQRFRQPIRSRHKTTTLVFYPHGSLVLCRDRLEQEFKIRTRDTHLLETILQRWEGEDVVPLFVSEGMQQQKVSSIKNSYYLSTVYREVLTSQRNTLVIYGWALNKHDLHLLQQMSQTGIHHVAVSVFQRDQIYCGRTSQIIRDILGHSVEVEFFDSESPGCWIKPYEMMGDLLVM